MLRSALAVALCSHSDRFDRTAFFGELSSACESAEYREKMDEASRVQAPEQLARIGFQRAQRFVRINIRESVGDGAGTPQRDAKIVDSISVEAPRGAAAFFQDARHEMREPCPLDFPGSDGMRVRSHDQK